MLGAMRGRWRWIVSLPLLAFPGPCTTFDGESPSEPDAGVDVDAAPPDATYLSLADAVSVCVLVGRCPTLQYSIGLSLGIPLDQKELPACVQMLAGKIPSSRRGLELQRGALARIVSKKDCGEALETLPVELIADQRCNIRRGCNNATEAVACDDSSGQLIGTINRCATDRGGPQCTTVTLPNDGGTYGVCSEGACTGTFVADAHCEGTKLVTCDPQFSKIKSTFDCAWVGLGCGKGSSDYATCLSPEMSAKCPGFGAADCFGDTMRYCISGDSQQSWSTFACAEVGASCEGGRFVDGGGVPPVCTPKDAECSPFDADIGACDASNVALCVDGKRLSFDCATLGKQCDRVAKGCQ